MEQSHETTRVAEQLLETAGQYFLQIHDLTYQNRLRCTFPPQAIIYRVCIKEGLMQGDTCVFRGPSSLGLSDFCQSSGIVA